MQQTYDNQKIAELFFAPVEPLLEACAHQRPCPELSDWQWVRMGIERVIKDERSGRSFLQDWAMGEGRGTPVQVSHFFQSLKSPRRLRLVEELSRTLAAAMPSHPCSLVPQIEELAKIDLYAGDGHYHAASAHDQPIKGKRRAVGHFYTLNLRSHGLTHLTACDLQGGRKKAEHDMHALKRLSIAQLRQGAAKGRQVLYIWDRAGIDLRQWHRWKQAGGLYFLSRAKENLKITRYGGIDFDREDPLNAGVLSDEHAATETAGVMCRYIRYRCPQSGTAYAFITNQMKIRPGVLAWLYLRRWDIEKTYDTFKNKLTEQKAWGASGTAKTMQAQFLCLGHNLMVLLENITQKRFGVENSKEITRAHKRIKQIRETCEAKGQERSPLYENPRKRSQLTLKFIRWLRYHLRLNSLLSEALASLRRIYALF